MLNIFHTGGLTLGISIVALALIGWFLYQTYTAVHSGGIQQAKPGELRPTYDDNKTPFYKVNAFWYAVTVLALYIIAMLAIASDYKGV